MPKLYRENWPQGWTPNADSVNGNPEGLLRADNLTQDEHGVLSLIRGTRKISHAPLATAPSQLYSHLIDLNSVIGSPGGYPVGNNHVRYAVVGNQVVRNFGPSTKSETIYDWAVINGGGDQGAGFAFGAGHVFITYGTQKFKDNGVKQTPIGMGAAAPPGVGYNTPPKVIMRGPNTNYVEFAAKENGTVFNNSSTYVLIDTSADNNRAVAVGGQFVALNINAMALNGVAETGTDADIYSIAIRVGNTATLVKVRVEYLCQPPLVPGFNPDATDYYWHEWTAGSGEEGTTEFNAGINTWTTLKCRRDEFTREGTDPAVNWRIIKGIRITFVATEHQEFAFTDPVFEGGTKGPLSGEYKYIQVNIQDNGYYTERSLPSVPSAVVTPINSSNYIQPSTVHPQSNGAWIYRSGGGLGGDYYLIKQITGADGFTPAQFNDEISDEDALRIGVKLELFQQNLPDGIIGIETNFKGRNWYITYEDIYPSYRDNFSSYDSRYVINTSGNTEYNLFITKLSTDALILATNRDFYEISGSAGVIVQDNIEFFDLTVRPLGIKAPSISKEFAVREGNLFYLAADGIRVLAGTTCQLMSNNIDLLFNNYTRHEIAPSKLIPMEPIYWVQVGNGRLYFSTQQTDNKRVLYIYTFATQTWRYEYHGDVDSIQAIFIEEDGTIIYSTALFGDKFMRVLDTGTLFDEVNNIPFKFLSVFDHAGAPNNRKDSYTLKMTCDSGNSPIGITVRGLKQDNSIISWVTTATFIGKSEQQFNLYEALGTVKYYQIELSGNVAILKLYNLGIEFDARPTQLTSLRVPPNNYGTASRKRINEIPLSIDTLGTNVNITPVLDGVNHPVKIVNTVNKAVWSYIFPYDASAYDVELLVNGGLFEFYDLITPREIEVLPDPILYKILNNTNLGTTSRKRFLQYAVIINTYGQPVEVIPIIDGVQLNDYAKHVSTTRKQTVILTLGQNQIGVDIACTVRALSTTSFELWGPSIEESVYEKLPPIAEYMHVAYTNLGTTSRKRFIQYAIVIDTRGQDVEMIPNIDGITFAPQIINTDSKRTVIYTFHSDFATGVDISCTLRSINRTPFEFYQVSLDDSVFEKLPPKSKYAVVPVTNFGTAAKKRIRTIPFQIDTFGHDVIFKPSADGVEFPSSTFNTNGKRTVLHYFENKDKDFGLPFAIDYGGILEGSHDFEFYQMLQPENVETLPVGKKFDQFGPIEFSKVGKIREVSIRILPTGFSLSYTILQSDSVIIEGAIKTIPNQERTYVISLPKGINPNIFRMEIYAIEVFHRFDAEVKVNIDGAVTENKRIRIK